MAELGLTHNMNSNDNEFIKTIIFFPKTTIVFKEKNISNTRFTGEMSKIHKLDKANIISSYLDTLHANQSSFNNSDIKDSRLFKSSFKNCDFNHASHNNNWVKDCNYDKCTFSQTSVTLSDYNNCSFINCDFSNVIISDCRFINCLFSNCTTSNKMIESSLLFDCSFKKMKIEIDLVLGNFGLSKDNLIDCSFKTKIATNLKSNNSKPIPFVLEALKEETNNIQRFKLEYFVSPSMIKDVSEKLDQLFNIGDWLKLCRNPNRFKLYIEKLHEFLLFQFDSNNLRLRTLIKLFDICSQLSDAISKRTDLIDLQRTVDGIFITIERILEQYFTIAKVLLVKFEEDGFCRLLVEGPLDKDYYCKELEDILAIAPVNFGKIIKHNSPNELFIHWEDIKQLWPLILFVFSTKFKFELNKLDEKTLRIKSKSSQIARGNQILKFESGFLENSDNFSFRLRTLLPGHRELNLVMQLSADRYKKLMRIVKDVIVFDEKKRDDKLQ